MAEPQFGIQDKVKVNYAGKVYTLKDCIGVIVSENKKLGYRWKIRLLNNKDEPLNVGHDDAGGAPGSGPYIHVDSGNLTLVEKYQPKVLKGTVKNNWKVGDKFMIKPDLGLENSNDDEDTGISEHMLTMRGKVLTVMGISQKVGPTWIFDNVINRAWLPQWLDPVE